MRHLARAAGVIGLSVGVPLAAQDRVSITAEDARECAVWASYLSSEMADDPEAVEALLFATNYFVGYYEGKTGRSIVIGDDMDAAMAIARDIEAVSQKCGTYMGGYGERMIAWGAALEAYSANVPAAAK